MPRKAAGLTAAKVRTAKPGRYGDGNGLYLFVRSTDARFWVFRYTRTGRMREMGLGSARTFSLAEARTTAADLHRKVKLGIDPLAERDALAVAAGQAVMFEEVADSYIAAHEAGWRNPKHRQQWRNTIDTYAVPTLGKLPVGTISTGDVMLVLDPIWREKSETASRLRGRIESILDFAAARGWRSGENPARWRGHLDNLLPAPGKVAKVQHHPALPWREIGAFMGALRGQEGVSALALRFVILTACRTGEAIGARWSEIDMTEALWTVPGDRMKAGREHRVPLSDGALDVMREVAKLRTDKGAGAPVFPGGKVDKPLSSMALLMLLRRMERADLTAHGFRSTFRDWCAESTNHPREVAEAALAHTLRDKTEAAYQRGDLMEKRRRLMADWAAFCNRPAPAGEVVPIRTAVT
jgi:integrase